MTVVDSSGSATNSKQQLSLGCYAVGMMVTAVAYALTGLLGLSVATVERNVTLFWPPTGIAVALLFRGGLWFWPGVFAGALLVNLQVSSLETALGVAVGNTLAPIVAVVLLRRFQFDPHFRRPLDLFLLLFPAALGAMLVSSANGTFWLRANGIVSPDRMWDTWLTWWLGDATGVVVFSPLLLSIKWADVRSATVRTVGREFVALAVMVACCWLAFSNFVPTEWLPPLLFLPFLVLIWVGLNHHNQSASVHLMVLAGFAVWGTAHGAGVFGQQSIANKFVLIWATLTISSLMTLMLTTVLAQRDRATAALAAADDYHALLHDTPAMICRYTSDGTITFANESLCRFIGLPRQQVVGRNILEYLTDMPRPNAVSELQAVANENLAISHLGTYRRADGVERWHRWTAHAVVNPKGDVREYHAVGVDITERRRAEEERRSLERKMLEAQRLESLGVLAGGVAHGFNNLFAGILGHAELAVAGTSPDSSVMPHLDVIVRGVKEASGLTRQLLAYSGKGKFLVRPTRVDSIVRKIAPLLRVTIPKSVELTLNITETPPVSADESQLRQVIVNLVTNAGEAIGDKPGTIKLGTAVRDTTTLDTPAACFFEPLPAGRYVVIRVTDTGCGIDDATRKRLFDPFFSTKFAGRGLGMPAVLGIVRAHSGGIHVASTPGLGTTVTVFLPVCAGDITIEPSTFNQETPPTITASERSIPTPATPPSSLDISPVSTKGTVLVVDDEESVRRVAQLMLEQLGYTVLTANDGVEAVEMFTQKSNAIRVVLLDLTMPRMDGAEVLAAIRNISPQVPVVLCSGFTEDAIPEHLANVGITGFLQKPFTMTELNRQIQRAVSK